MKRSSESRSVSNKRKKTDNEKSTAGEVTNERDDDGASISNVHTSTSVSQTSVSTSSSHYKEFFDYSLEEGIKHGTCKLCKKNDRAAKIRMMKSNRCGLKWHLMNEHRSTHDLLFPDAAKVIDKSQRTLEDVFGSLKQAQFKDNREFRILVVEWIAVKKLPLQFFDDELTQQFFWKISPSHDFPKRTALTTAVEETHTEIREHIMKLLQNNISKVSFSIDGWTSVTSKSYYGITATFIDCEWKMHSLAIDFVPSNGNHTGWDIARIFYGALERAKLLKKIGEVTVDNASVNTTFMQEFEELLRGIDLVFDANDQHFHCFPHILNLGAQDVIKMLGADDIEDTTADSEDCDDSNENKDHEKDNDDNEDVDNINFTEVSAPLIKLRTLCKKLKKSEQLKNKLRDCCLYFEEKLINLPLDVSTRWNSSHDLITAGLRMQNSISALSTRNPNLRHLAITKDEWILLAMLQKYFQCFKKLSNLLWGDQYPTLPSVVVGINILLDSIETLGHQLDVKSNRSTIEEKVILAFQAGRDKILKHYDKTNWIYRAVLIPDPRHKLEAFDKTKWGRDLKERSKQKFEMIFRAEYANQAECNDDDGHSQSHESDDEYTRQFNDLYSSDDCEKLSWERELDTYFRQERVGRDTDIMEWWRGNETTFPTLALMAKDLLAICASSAASERLFSKAGLILRDHRSRLSDPHAETLLCLSSWFQCSLTPKLKADINY